MKREKSKINFKNSKNTKLILSIFILLLVSAVFVYAIDTLSTGYRVPKNGGSKEITAHGIPCKKVTNNNPSRDIFVPTNKSTEWTNFISNHPSFVSIVDCATGTCSSQCTGRECGDDGCGGSCGTCFSWETCDSSGSCVEESSEPTNPDIPTYCSSDSDCDVGCRYITRDVGATCIYDCTTYVCRSGSCVINYVNEEEVSNCYCNGCPGSDVCSCMNSRCSCEECRPVLGCIVNACCESPAETFWNCPQDC